MRQRRRACATETEGRPCQVQASCRARERDGTKPLRLASRGLWRVVRTVFTDGGHAGGAEQRNSLVPSSVARPRVLPRVAPPPRLRVIARRFGWLVTARRRVADVEQGADLAGTRIRSLPPPPCSGTSPSRGDVANAPSVGADAIRHGPRRMMVPGRYQAMRALVTPDHGDDAGSGAGHAAAVPSPRGGCVAMAGMLVELRGIEPLASSLRTTRSPN